MALSPETAAYQPDRVTMSVWRAFAYAVELVLRIMLRWLERPCLAVFPVIGAIAECRLAVGIVHHNDRAPFRQAVIIFLAAFATLALSFWPCMIPFAVTIEAAAAPLASLRVMFWGAGPLVIPLTLLYTVAVYSVFRGKVVDAGYE